MFDHSLNVPRGPIVYVKPETNIRPSKTTIMFRSYTFTFHDIETLPNV